MRITPNYRGLHGTSGETHPDQGLLDALQKTIQSVWQSQEAPKKLGQQILRKGDNISLVGLQNEQVPVSLRSFRPERGLVRQC